MSATTAGAVKAHLEGKGLGIPFFRDLAPQDQRLPFGVVQEGISRTPDRSGSVGDPDHKPTLAEQVQVSIFQPFRDEHGRAAEDYTLVSRTMLALHGARLPTAPTLVYGVLVRSAVRVPRVDQRGSAGDESDRSNVVHDAITITVHREF